MILGDIVSYVAGKVGFSGTTFSQRIRDWAHLRQQMLWNEAVWKDSLSIYTKSAAAAQKEIILPSQIDMVVAVKQAGQGLPMLPVDQVFLFSSETESWESSGPTLRFSQPPALGLAVAIPTDGGEKLTCKSSSAADVGKKLTIYGELAGIEKTEQVTLNGTMDVDSVESYTDVFSLSKEVTTGSLSVTGKTSATLLQTLKPTEAQKRHPRLRLHQIPTSTLPLLVLGKRHAPPLKQDTDATALARLDNALLAFVVADALESLRQYAKSQAKAEEGMALLASVKRTEVYQQASACRLTPADSVGDLEEA